MNYRERRAAGLCVKCGEPAAMAKKTLPVAQKLARETGKTVAEVYHMALCGKCEATKKTRSQDQKDVEAATRVHNAKRYYGSKDAGRCIKCLSPARHGRVTCEECAEKMADNYKARQKRRADDPSLCNTCGRLNETPSFSRCGLCRRRRREYYRRKVTR